MIIVALSKDCGGDDAHRYSAQGIENKQMEVLMMKGVEVMIRRIPTGSQVIIKKRIQE